MNDRRRPWWRSTYVVLAAAVLFASGAVVVGSTLANFTTETDNGTSTFPGGYVGAASSLGVTPSGYDGQLAWTPGTHGPVTGQQLYSLDNGSSSSCPASGYSLAANMASASTASYTQSNPDSTTLSSAVGVTTLGAAVTTTNGTTITVSASTTFPSVPFVILIGSEQMNVTAESGAGNKTWTVTRGYNGTTAATHLNGTAVNQVSIAVANGTGFPQSGSFTIQVNAEQMTVTSGQGTGAVTWIVNRGANSTTIAAHVSGALVTQTSDPLNGHYLCYEMVSTSATNWTATASFPATQLGLVPLSVTTSTPAVSGTPKSGDFITVTYNQAPTLTSLANVKLCFAWPAGTAPVAVTIFLEYTTCATTNTAYQVEITGLTKGTTGSVTAGTSASNVTVTITGNSVKYALSANPTGTPYNTGTITAIPDSDAQWVRSSATTDQAPACASVTYNCQPTVATTW